ncbi:MAG: hypothetical protein ATN31_01750 [Candidatus Epulonipiscioides saccharophilum]|nr:MAG: hypothetical protein ATN31_01750 [Epulopiscium sp. AS2M-Bin001]
MSNHTGSYMLNNVLCELSNQTFFALLPLETRRSFAKRIMNIGTRCDCNEYEILEDVGRSVGLCEHCGTHVPVGEMLCNECADYFDDNDEAYDYDEDDED